MIPKICQVFKLKSSLFHKLYYILPHQGMGYETGRGILFKFNIFSLFCGIIMGVSEIWKQLYLTFGINGGVYQWWFFPFQLCSIAMYILLALPWVRSLRLRQMFLCFLMSYSMLGGIAVFADTSGLHYPVLPLTIHSYLWHILLIIVGIISGITYIGENKICPYTYKFHFLRFYKATLLYFLCCLIATLINDCFDSYGNINMFYINPDYPMQQVFFSSLVKYIGNIPSIIVYMSATILGACILFSIWHIAAHYLMQKRKPQI